MYTIKLYYKPNRHCVSARNISGNSDTDTINRIAGIMLDDEISKNRSTEKDYYAEISSHGKILYTLNRIYKGK